MQGERSSSVRKRSVAACAAAIAASVGLAAPAQPADARVIDQVQRYCTASWRNAGIHPQDWSDCTQETLLRLLERVPKDRIGTAVRQGESDERRELKRAVWRTVQRWRRAPRFTPLDGQFTTTLEGSHELDAVSNRETIAGALGRLSARQRRILVLWSQGWAIDEIARKLHIPAPRASDEKYKALRKLRRQLSELDGADR